MPDPILTHISQRASVNLPRPDEVVDAMVARATGDAPLLSENVTVYNQREPIRKVYPFLALYRPTTAPRPEDPSRILRVEVHARFEIAGRPNGADRWLDYLHALLFASVNGYATPLTYAVLLHAPTRTDSPAAAAYDADDDASYSTAIYRATIAPIP